MVVITVTSRDNLTCDAAHQPSGTSLLTDAPTDVGGQASSFSPTDLVATALLTCIMTTMGLAANRLKVDLTGMSGTVEKEMSKDLPRRIARLRVVLHVPGVADEAVREKLQHAALHCPVHHTLHPDTAQEIEIVWD